MRYEYCDFHSICKNQRFDRINPLIKKLWPNIENFLFYLEDVKTSSVLMEQKGVVRVNCLDNLDRTNFVQTKIAAAML